MYRAILLKEGAQAILGISCAPLHFYYSGVPSSTEYLSNTCSSYRGRLLNLTYVLQYVTTEFSSKRSGSNIWQGTGCANYFCSAIGIRRVHEMPRGR